MHGAGLSGSEAAMLCARVPAPAQGLTSKLTYSPGTLRHFCTDVNERRRGPAHITAGAAGSAGTQHCPDQSAEAVLVSSPQKAAFLHLAKIALHPALAAPAVWCH